MIRRVARRMFYAGNGLWDAFRTDHAVQLHALIAFAVIFLGLLSCLPSISWALLVLTIGSVLAVELLNSALEHLTDRLHPARDSKIQRAKDIAAGAVMVNALAALIIGCVVFLPPVMQGTVLTCLF